MASQQGNRAGGVLTESVHQALIQLYDPDRLGRSPLLAALGLRQVPDPTLALRHVLVDAIEALKPEDGVPPQATAWRLYRVLRHRYVEQIPQHEVAFSLALSQRQLRRYEKIALTVLTNLLVSAYGLQAPGPDEAAGEAHMRTAGTADQELQWLQESVASESATFTNLLGPVLETLDPVLRASSVVVECTLPDDLPLLAVHMITLRQALMSILTAATHAVPGGRVRIRAEAQSSQIVIHIEPTAGRIASLPLSQEDMESLEMARSLAAPSAARLELSLPADPAAPFMATLVVPVAQKATVLVIDDNADTLGLFQRYLEGSPYTFAGLRDPEQALAKATTVMPRVIVLDVMLPHMDGWELLGRLREHPVTRHIPIIVCTILPQERLALTLGAAGFLRKPITRSAFLAALDAQVHPPRSVR